MLNPYEAPSVANPYESAPRGPQINVASLVTAVCQVLVGGVCGYSIWTTTAPAEAWDANPLYSVWVGAAGLLSSFGRAKEPYWGVLGVYLGQVAAIWALIDVGSVPIMPASISVLIFGTLPAFLGALLGGLCGKAVLQMSMRGRVK